MNIKHKIIKLLLLFVTLDLSVLARLVGDSPDTHRKFLGKFITTAADTIEAIHQASRDNSAEEVSQLAHKLKSSARTMGADNLGDLCESLEKAGKSGNLSRVDELKTRLDRSFCSIKRQAASLWPNNVVGNELKTLENISIEVAP